jgi:hypothetical protein
MDNSLEVIIWRMSYLLNINKLYVQDHVLFIKCLKRFADRRWNAGGEASDA